MKRILVALVVLAFAGPSAVADPPKPLAESVRAALATEDAAARAAAFDAIVAARPDPAALADAIAAGRTWKPDAPKGLVTWTRKDLFVAEDPHQADRSHQVFAHVPESYDPAKAWPVVLWMHGGVSMTEDGAGSEGVQLLSETADEVGFIVLSPSSRRGAEWWTPVGVEYLRGCLRDLMERYHVDADRVAAMGMSDGGSACFHLLAHDPDPYASLVAVVPMPTVTRIMGGPTFAANVSSRPVWAVSGGKDPLYPAPQVKPLIEELKAAGCDLTWSEVPDAGHDITYLSTRRDEILAFVKDHPRKALPETVSWETALPATEGRRAWVEILAVDPAAPSAEGFESKEFRTEARPRPRIGIAFDTSFQGPGMKIERVEPGSPAHAGGFRADDVLVKAGEMEIVGENGFMRLRDYIGSLGDKDGDFVVKRGGEEVTLHARPQVMASDIPPRPKELGYDVSSGRIEAKAVGGNRIEVRTHGVKSFRLLLAPPLVDPAKEVVVLVNGKERFRAVPEPDLRGMLDRAAFDLPGSTVFRAKVDLAP